MDTEIEFDRTKYYYFFILKYNKISKKWEDIYKGSEEYIMSGGFWYEFQKERYFKLMGIMKSDDNNITLITNGCLINYEI
jgi:hypothetical protein